ncbi:mitochondrial intermembrane space translocase subunit Tim10 [Sporothrix brasiliensis 5110]|uniref:Mitochondrial import inner membrane translocase subunit n=1 Tax=Sporothrix brasiliensis 5110 TaxID=1398154 RepID=A0A0C2ESB9_9PEZI|nr:mitochondrial intermembrane space translocase subunit Tim10 [Sporothrix brasiliensis 5110]KIH89249.1 mitochondrial intermembrane space translocase subunit Tim10 [Sporothrix brasiliensis 5110]
MSFFGMGRPQLSSAEKIASVEAEMKMMSDMHNRLIKACAAKCVPTDYRESELNKGESVCLDRCAAKFFAVHMNVSEHMQQEAAKRNAGGGGGMF